MIEPTNTIVQSDNETAIDLIESVDQWRKKALNAKSDNSVLSKIGDRHINVCVRTRPMLPRESDALGCVIRHGGVEVREYECLTSIDPSKLYFHEEVLKVGEPTGQIKTKEFEVHRVFGPINTNDDIYQSIGKPLIDYTLSGGSSCCLAYGQTGSGKTYTQTGIQERAAIDIFERLPSDVECYLSFFENRGDKIYDLLYDRNEAVLREDSSGQIQVVGIQEKKIKDLESFNLLLHEASHLRSTACTQTNNQSSRSHGICCITLRNISSGKEQGNLRIVDLAGSERREDADHHSMERINEMKDINWSLGCLKECIRCQVLKESGQSTSVTHIPYRNCRLTMLLKDCFSSSNVKTVIISHVSPTYRSHLHTANTLDYTTQMVQISRAEQEKKKFAGPEAWSKKKFSAWVKQLDGGKFSKLADSFQISGKMFSVTWRNDIEKRAVAAGGSEADGREIYDRFHAGLKNFKAKQKRESHD